MIKKWTEGGNPNTRHYLSLLDAEAMAWRGQLAQAANMYESSILFSARGGFQQDAALACERAGDFYLNIMKDEEEAGVCHHIYWLTAAEMGYSGLAVLLLILARFLSKMAWQVRGEPVLERYLLFGILVGMCALHTIGLLEWVFRVMFNHVS